MKYLKLLLLTILLLSLLSGNEADTSYTNGQFIFSGIGSGTGNFKDIGTSPLTYRGISAIVPFGFFHEKQKYSFELKTTISYLGGTAASYYNLNYFSSELNLSYLRSIPLFSEPRVKFQAGGKISASIAGVHNPAYQNAQLNLDYFVSLYTQARITYLFERPEKKIKISFLNFHLPHRQFAAFFSLDLPLLLLNGRPTFPYVMEDDMDIFNRHFFLGGFHLRSNVGIKHYLKNGNAFELSYVWCMRTSGSKDLYLMETASHNLLMSLYFKLD